MAAALDELAAEVDARRRPRTRSSAPAGRPRRSPPSPWCRPCRVRSGRPRPGQAAEEASTPSRRQKGRTRSGAPACAARSRGRACRRSTASPRAGGDSCLVQPLHERGEVVGDRRADVRVDDGRARALVLADLGEDLRRAVTYTPSPTTARTISSTRRSCVSSTYECRSAIATASTPAPVAPRPPSRTEGSSSSTQRSPRGPSRSVTSKRSRRGTSGRGASYWMS